MNFFKRLNKIALLQHVCFSICYLSLCFFVLVGDGLAADNLFSLIPVVLQIGSQKWEISVDQGEMYDHLHFTYGKEGVIVDEGQIVTALYSDTSPAAMLVNDSPLLVWSGSRTKNGDSDIYFSNWNGSCWETPMMVHKDNKYADMSPELHSNGSSIVLTWWRNTGSEIMKMQGTYNNGTWEIERSSIAASVRSGVMKTSSTDYYEDVSPRFIQPIKCIAFGDSITAGCMRNAEGDMNYWCSHNHSGETADGYVDSLIVTLQDEREDSVVYNYGNHGERSYQGASRIGEVLDAQTDANCILIMYGANDRYQGLLPTDTRANIKYIADYAIARDVIPVIATISPNTAVGGINEYNEQIRELVEEEGITLADQYDALAPNWSRNTSGDGLHLSSEGNIVAAAEWYEAMKGNDKLFPKYSLVDMFQSLSLLLKSQKDGVYDGN